MTLLILVIVAVVIVFMVRDIRLALVSRPVFRLFKRVLPPLSQTEREAMEAGDVWWDAELFSGTPDWSKLHKVSRPGLSKKEKAFVDNQVETLCAMLDDHTIVQKDKDLPEEVWQYLKDEGFFALIIPEKFGGKAFSAVANSTIVARIATRSLSAAVTVMVPNSLGPAELLLHYGTEEQQNHWLPRLASGEELPCFALTAPEAGSDAGAIPDTGIVCHGEHDGERVLGIRLNWSKRYITLAPVASVLGLAFKLYDPDQLLGENKDIGITCALIPVSHPGVETGERHLPMGLAFMNGTTYGKDVFIPMDWIIGGQDCTGRGWRMLVECLSAGRGISLPALSTATGHLCSRMTSAYAVVRQQFGVSLSQFEGVQEALGRIGGMTYALEAMRLLTAHAIDLKMKPAVITAIAKYHMTEMGRQVMDDALDIHAGKGIQLGKDNYLGQGYMGVPISITVEGANILTRNLMIFGQGAIRCHPWVLKEMEAAAIEDEELGLEAFDPLLMGHLLFGLSNAGMSLFYGLTGARFAPSPVCGDTAVYYRHLTRISRALALCSDVAMMVLGGELKRREMLSARLGDVLSQLYIASCILKRFEDEGHQQADLPFVRYGVENALYQASVALEGFFDNFPSRWIAWPLKRLVFPFGNLFSPPSDDTIKAMCSHMTEPGVLRNRLSHLCYIDEQGGTGVVERAFVSMDEAQGSYRRLKTLIKEGKIASSLSFDAALEHAERDGLMEEADIVQLRDAEVLRKRAIAVNVYKKGEL